MLVYKFIIINNIRHIVNELHNIVKTIQQNDPLYIYCYGDPILICKLYNNNCNKKLLYQIKMQ